MKKHLLVLALMLSMAASTFAVEVEIDGLWYEVLSKTKEAKVIQYKNNKRYSGNIVIRETVAKQDGYSGKARWLLWQCKMATLAMQN